MYCASGSIRIDEAFLLLSAELVQRVVATPDLKCGAHAGVTVGWWFTKGKPLNQLGDVQLVADPRLDHEGDFLKKSPAEFGNLCSVRMGVHHTYPDAMLDLWAAAEAVPGPGSEYPLYGSSLLEHNEAGACEFLDDGVSDHRLRVEHVQPCDTFKASGPSKHCGRQGC